MFFKCLQTALFLFFSFALIAQETIQLHSVSIDRQLEGETGYTLNGENMNESSRLKLLNPNNFGPGGTYEKTIEITDDYGLANDLITIGQNPDIDLFYFGSFNLPDFADNPFTAEEIDSLYAWSLRGGKMIISGSSSAPEVGIDFRVLEERWNFGIELVFDPNPGQVNIPVEEASGLSLFAGPFGEALVTDQGGLGQGYFNLLPENALVLAEDINGEPTIILDCTTLDLILADGDTHNILGGVTDGLEINSVNDQFWGNTIVFMDNLPDPPAIVIEDGTLVTGSFESYQWFRDGAAISGATSSSFTPTEPGQYSVTVGLEVGCMTPSATINWIPTQTREIEQLSALNISPNPARDWANLNLELSEGQIIDISLLDMQGRMVGADLYQGYLSAGSHQLQLDTSNLPAGTYIVALQSKGQIDKLRLVKR
ncbi:MAG: T9SS type A sorting domain-containing protein [Mameliella sp.]|nr:T9SS type A sorting domain-containing protein [Phaeodactylibacter sp.]